MTHSLKLAFFSLLTFGFSQVLFAIDLNFGDFEEHRYDTSVSTEGAKRAPVGKVTMNAIIYGQSGHQTHRGYLSKPADQETKSGLIVIHEWWGLNEDVHAMNNQLAALGYSALAVDLYNGELATEPADAFKLSTHLSNNEKQALANLQTAYDYLISEVGVSKVGVIGWCLGGKWSLRTALMLPEDIDATVIYYGSLVNDKNELSKLEMPIIGFVGTKDTRLYKEFLEFEKTLQELNKNASFHYYEGAKHAFANASGLLYQEIAAEDSWEKTVNFLQAHLD
jgi:carboxymethylenebutenolidase